MGTSNRYFAVVQAHANNSESKFTPYSAPVCIDYYDAASTKDYLYDELLLLASSTGIKSLSPL
ncbi:MAG: hypothetical protein AAF915_01870 [Cyanobacteria bacterium P01_D01_bin.50]